jgi:hypothetical protein
MDIIGQGEEESVDALIAKLNSKGAKVKLVNDDEDEFKKQQTPTKTPSKKNQQLSGSDKENFREHSAPGVDVDKMREMEESKKQQQEIVLLKQ